MTTQEEEKTLNEFLSLTHPTREQEIVARELLEKMKSILIADERDYEREMVNLEREEEDLERETKNFALFIAHAEQLEKEKKQLRQQEEEKRLPLDQREFSILLSVLDPIQMVSFSNSMNGNTSAQEKKSQLDVYGYKTNEVYYIRVNDPTSGDLLMEQKIPRELLAL